MKDKYIFDYNIVAKLDPSYKQYLTEERPQEKDVIEIMTAPVAPEVQVTLRERTPDGASLTDDDMSVINVVSATNVHPPEPISRSDRHFPREFAEAEISSPKSLAPTLYLKPEFNNSKLNGRKICSPRFQLCPPKNVLSPGSKVYEDKKVWTMTACGPKSNPDTAILHKRSISIGDDKIRYVITNYWFNRLKNVTSEQSSQTKMLTYNKKTRNLYKIYKVKTGTKNPRRYKYTIHSVLMNYLLCAEHMTASRYIAHKFIKELEKAVKCDVPDAYTPTPTDVKDNYRCLPYTIELLVLQHKLGKRIDWIDKSLYMKVSSILHDKHSLGDHMVDIGYDYLDKMHKAKIRKFIPSLKKHTNYTSLIEAAFGKLYNKILLKLIPYDSDISIYTHIAYHINENHMPKTMYHLLHTTINSDLPDTNKRTILGHIYNALISNNEGHTDIVNTWTIAALRFIKNGFQPPTTYMWRDMYQMAERYHVRIRPRKFNTPNDVQQFHNKLVAIQNRDRKVLDKYRNRDFLPFEVPDKLYNGFQFKFLGTPTALVEEGVSMHHCVGGYADRCLSGHSLIFSMRKDDVGYVTVELSGSVYQITQKYTINDNLVNNSDICDIIDTWQQDVVKIHEEDENSYYDLCNPSTKPLTNDDSDVEVNDINDAAPVNNNINPDGLDWLFGTEPTAVAF